MYRFSSYSGRAGACAVIINGRDPVSFRKVDWCSRDTLPRDIVHPGEDVSLILTALSKDSVLRCDERQNSGCYCMISTEAPNARTP